MTAGYDVTCEIMERGVLDGQRSIKGIAMKTVKYTKEDKFQCLEDLRESSSAPCQTLMFSTNCARCARRWSVADSSEKEVIRITWDEWLASRAAKRAALAAKGLSAPSRRTTSRTAARRAAQEIVRAK